tara:strand:+ start:5738 stop:7024 length:1287 start_codon:yes stop_codon:yes gene_type:complete
MIFSGSNNLGAKEVFMQRALYSGLAYSGDTGEVKTSPPLTKNFWLYENLFYGRIREINNTIYSIEPKEEYMKNLTTTGGPPQVMVLDFVADAYAGFLRDYQKAIVERKVNIESEYLSGQFLATKGYLRATKEYDKYKDEVYSAFSENYERDKKFKEAVSSFDTYMPQYVDFLLKVGKSLPITKTGFMVSGKSSPMASGLCVEVADLKHSVDSIKNEFFIDDCNFGVYQILAANNGFLVDKNAPWRLVADISSTQMLKYATAINSSIGAGEDILDFYFSDASSGELEDLQRSMVRNYNIFARKIPRTYAKSVNNNKIVTTEINRSTESFDSVKERMGSDTWWKAYTRIKNIECSMGYPETELLKIAMNATELEKVFDTDRSMGYINEKFIPFVGAEGSLNYRYIASKANVDDLRKIAQSSARNFNKNVY